MIRVLVIFGTRPEAIKMAPIVAELRRRSAEAEVVVCVTGQHRQMLDQILQVFEIHPDFDLGLMSHNQALSSLTARALEAVTKVIQQVQPSFILVQGDTTTAMAGALAGFYEKIPVGHVEAGLRTGIRYYPFPEEINRRLISVMTTLHFAPTRTAAAALTAEGISQSDIYVTGNTVVDALQQVAARDSQRPLPCSLQGGRLILVTAHRRENFGAPLQGICEALLDIADTYSDVEIVYPVHLNPNVQSTVRSTLSGHPRIHLLPPLDYLDFVQLLKRAHLVLTDSGGIQEEAPTFGIPVLVLRNETERPEGVEAGTARIVGTNRQEIVTTARHLLDNPRAYAAMASAVSPYGDGHAAERIVDVILKRLGDPESVRRDVAVQV